MQRAIATFLFVGICLAATSVRAQPAVDRLEKKLRERSPAGKAAGRAPGDEKDQDAREEVAPAPQEKDEPQLLPGGEGAFVGMDIDDTEEEGAGVRVTRIEPKGPAERGGLEYGDLIVAIDGVAIDSTEMAVDVLAGAEVGQIVTFDVERPELNGEATLVKIKVTLGKRAPPRPGGATMGVRVERVTPADLQVLNLPGVRGALVVEVAPGSPAETAGVPVDAVIVTLGGRAVEEPRDLEQLIANARPGERMRLGFWFDGQLEEVEVVLAGAAGRAPRKKPVAADQQNEGGRPQAPDAATRIAELERKIMELEARITALEAQAKAPKERPAPQK